MKTKKLLRIILSISLLMVLIMRVVINIDFEEFGYYLITANIYGVIMLIHSILMLIYLYRILEKKLGTLIYLVPFIYGVIATMLLTLINSSEETLYQLLSFRSLGQMIIWIVVYVILFRKTKNNLFIWNTFLTAVYTIVVFSTIIISYDSSVAKIIVDTIRYLGAIIILLGGFEYRGFKKETELI